MVKNYSSKRISRSSKKHGAYQGQHTLLEPKEAVIIYLVAKHLHDYLPVTKDIGLLIEDKQTPKEIAKEVSELLGHKYTAKDVTSLMRHVARNDLHLIDFLDKEVPFSGYILTGKK